MNLNDDEIEITLALLRFSLTTITGSAMPMPLYQYFKPKVGDLIAHIEQHKQDRRNGDAK